MLSKYCGQCKEIDFKKKKCSKHNIKLAYCRIKKKGLPWSYFFERCDVCRDEQKLGERQLSLEDIGGSL